MSRVWSFPLAGLFVNITVTNGDMEGRIGPAPTASALHDTVGLSKDVARIGYVSGVVKAVSDTYDLRRRLLSRFCCL